MSLNCGSSISQPAGLAPLINLYHPDQHRLRHLDHTGTVTQQVHLTIANDEVLCAIENLTAIPQVYVTLFHLTQKFAATVRHLVATTAAQSPARWAEAACLLIDWSIDVLRNKKVGFDRFLNSQRGSIYFILDDALLRICLDQWENPCSTIPWDAATAPICKFLARAQKTLPGLRGSDLARMQKWHTDVHLRLNALETAYFERSRKFLAESTRIYELWRTIRLCAKGLLPAELANAIVEDVSQHEELPTQDLRTVYLRKS